jgi:hypothetical protein
MPSTSELVSSSKPSVKALASLLLSLYPFVEMDAKGFGTQRQKYGTHAQVYGFDH